ncbi:MAG: phosphomannomutase/phosphoglucomutase [Candidatus Manganitrophus sp. SB1]|nr:phosphomannomutase/phosphoglucomutase [Candidatus Manganitrophus morganii]
MSIFREYDIRGVYGTVLTEKVAEEIGKAFGTLIRRSGGKKISLGYDIRLSSPSLREALLAGLLSTGIDVVDIGACPTPVLYFSLFNLQVDGGVMITASHNPAEFNGFKLCRGKGTLYGAEIQQVRTMAESGDFDRGKGELTFEPDFLATYLRYFVKHFGSLRSKKVVVDCGNAAAALIAPQIFEQLGCEVIPLYCEPDGRFPNHHPDPTVPENIADLIACVRKERADVGIAFDGDGDRLGAVDEKGEIIWGDKLTLLFATDILKRSPGAIIISEVKASQVLYDEIARLGGNGIMWKTGHSLIKSKMKETGALLAGEMSGHLFFADRYFGYDDAIYAGCRLVEILVNSEQTLSSYFSDLPKTYATPEIRVDCPDDRKFAVVEKCREYFSGKYKTVDIDGIRILFEDGWGLIRASNTQPALVLRFEASSQARLTKMQEYIDGILAKVNN